MYFITVIKEPRSLYEKKSDNKIFFTFRGIKVTWPIFLSQSVRGAIKKEFDSYTLVGYLSK